MNAVLLYAGLVATCLSAGPRAAPGTGSDAAAAGASPAPVHATHEALFEFDDHELRFRSVFEFRTGGAPLSSLRFSLPEDARIDRVEAPNLAAYRVEPEAYELGVTLVTRPGGVEAVSITGHVPFDPEIALDAVLLPVLEPLDVERETGRVHLFAPAGLNLAVDRDIAVGAVPTVARPGPLPPGTRHVVSWAYRRRPVELLVEMSRAPLRMTARVATAATVHSRYVEVCSRVDYEIESGRTDVFQVAVPAGVSDEVRIEPLGGVAIAQTTRGEETVDGWVPWTVITREPLTDGLALGLWWELEPGSEPPEDRIVLISHAEDEPMPARHDRAWRVLLQPPRPFEQTSLEERPALRHTTGLLSVHAMPDLAVTTSPAAGNSEPLDASLVERVLELPERPFPTTSPAGGERECVEACQYDDQSAAWEVTWRRARSSGAGVVVSRAVVEIATAAAGDSRLHYRCRYRVAHRDGEPLLVEIPAGSDESDVKVLGAFCDGRAVWLRPAGETSPAGLRPFVMELPRAAGDDPRSISLHFRLRLGAPAFQGFGSLLELPLPRIGGDDALMSGTYAIVQVPESFALVGTPAGFEPLDGGSRASGGFDGPGAASGETPAFPASGRRYVFRRTSDDDVLVVTWWNMTVATWVLSAAAFVVALVLRPTSWRNRLNVVVFFGFAVAMLAVAAPDAVRQGLLASRSGLIAGALLWAFGALPVSNGKRQHAAAAAPSDGVRP